MPPCAPDELSNNRFWDALNGRAWFNNATLFGHVDFLDPGATVDVIDVKLSSFLCSNESLDICFPFLYSSYIFAHLIRKMTLIFCSVFLWEVKLSHYSRDCWENVRISCTYQRLNECLPESNSRNKIRKSCVPLPDVYTMIAEQNSLAKTSSHLLHSVFKYRQVLSF